MDPVTVLRDAGDGYWHRAVDPLHALGWETFWLFVAIILLVSLIATVLLRYSWVWSAPTIANARIKSAAHMYQNNLRVSPEDYLALHKVNSKLSFESEQVKSLLRKDSSRYYVITVVENGKAKALIYRELLLQIATRRGRAAPGLVQLDQQLLTDVRLGNGYEEDDAENTEIIGTYDIYIRRVRWYDVRHWLLHPNREIRIVVWVTLITTTLPVLLDVLFRN
ncbi:MAG: hypothetical protein ABL889_20880 [Terricaulis sp.]